MAHELHTNAAGKTSFAYIGEHAWHGLGNQLTADAPLALWEEEAGFNWTIESGAVQTPHPEAIAGDTPLMITMPERRLLYRSDTLAPLAVVSDKYKVVQPKEVLHFYEDLIESAGFVMETAGVMFGGRRFWAMARTNYKDEVIAGDGVAQYLLLTTACDGSLATTAKFTSVRVVCNNTNTMALNERGKTTVKVPHNANFDPQTVKVELGVAGEAWNTWLTDARRLASMPVNNNEVVRFLINLFGDPSATLEDQTPTAANVMQQVHGLWAGGAMGAALAGPTAWGLFNAVTEYYDWHTGHKTPDARINNAWLGEGDKKKLEAFDLLLAIGA